MERIHLHQPLQEAGGGAGGLLQISRQETEPGEPVNGGVLEQTQLRVSGNIPIASVKIPDKRVGQKPTPTHLCRGRRPRRPAGSNYAGCYSLRMTRNGLSGAGSDDCEAAFHEGCGPLSAVLSVVTHLYPIRPHPSALFFLCCSTCIVLLHRTGEMDIAHRLFSEGRCAILELKRKAPKSR